MTFNIPVLINSSSDWSEVKYVINDLGCFFNTFVAVFIARTFMLAGVPENFHGFTLFVISFISVVFNVVIIVYSSILLKKAPFFTLSITFNIIMIAFPVMWLLPGVFKNNTGWGLELIYIITGITGLLATIKSKFVTLR